MPTPERFDGSLMPLRPPSWTRLGLSGFFVLATLGLQFWPGASMAWMFSRPAYEAGATWQLLSSQWVHLDGWHASANVLAFVAIMFFTSPWLRGSMQLLALCGGYLGVALVLALDTRCSYYAGASGALHGLLAGSAVAMAWGQPKLQAGASEAEGGLATVSSGRRRLLAFTVLVGMALKLWWQSASGSAMTGAGWRFPVYQPAHIAGVVGGVGLVVLALIGRAVSASARDLPAKDRQH